MFEQSINGDNFYKLSLCWIFSQILFSSRQVKTPLTVRINASLHNCCFLSLEDNHLVDDVNSRAPWALWHGTLIATVKFCAIFRRTLYFSSTFAASCLYYRTHFDELDQDVCSLRVTMINWQNSWWIPYHSVLSTITRSDNELMVRNTDTEKFIYFTFERT